MGEMRRRTGYENEHAREQGSIHHHRDHRGGVIAAVRLARDDDGSPRLVVSGGGQRGTGEDDSKAGPKSVRFFQVCHGSSLYFLAGYQVFEFLDGLIRIEEASHEPPKDYGLAHQHAERDGED